MTLPGGRSLLPASLVVLAAAIFFVDTVTNLEIAVAVFYVAIVLVAVRYLDQRRVVVVASACMALTLLSFILTRAGSFPAGMVNCAISLAAIGVTAYLALRTAAAEAAARQAQAQLAHITRVTVLGELTASIAHELNQPLAAIVINGNAALRWLGAKPANPDEAAQAAERIVRDANRATDLIKRLRALTKRGPGKAVWLDVNQIIADTLTLVRSEVARNHVSLAIDLADELPPVQVDPVQIQQVISNLVLNATEAMSDRALPERRLRIAASQDGRDAIVLAVADSGTGLAPGAREHLFDAFWTTKEGGMGLGLTISQTIVEANGGQISAAPVPGGGTVFEVRLPRHMEAA